MASPQPAAKATLGWSTCLTALQALQVWEPRHPG
jgi:hypothetical protein